MSETLAYLFGALHDGYIYIGKRKGKVAVFTQKNKGWLETIKRMIRPFGYSAWIFKQRDIFVLETKFAGLFQPYDFRDFNYGEKVEFVSGFFDAEGGIPKQPMKSKLLYIQFVQKQKEILSQMIDFLERAGIRCGKLHQYDTNKSNCWRFFIRANSLIKFIKMVKSRHPSKTERLALMKKVLESKHE